MLIMLHNARHCVPPSHENCGCYEKMKIVKMLQKHVDPELTQKLFELA